MRCFKKTQAENLEFLPVSALCFYQLLELA
jgi:hypothetical protein